MLCNAFVDNKLDVGHVHVVSYMQIELEWRANKKFFSFGSENVDGQSILYTAVFPFVDLIGVPQARTSGWYSVPLQ